MNSSNLPPILPTCRECGAHLQPGSPRCWLCLAKLDGAEAPIRAELARPPEFSRVSEVIFGTISALVGLFLLVVIVGLWLQDSRAAMAFLTILTIPAAATAVRLTLRKRKVGRIGWGERLVTFLLSTALVVGLLVALMVAAFLAFFVWCLINPPKLNFH